jgi:hypothetical protein
MRFRRILIAAAILAFMQGGCVQRICEYNPDAGVWRYKSNSFATDARADRIVVKTRTGVEIAIDRAMQNNDSLTLRFNPITKQIEIVTTGDKK